MFKKATIITAACALAFCLSSGLSFAGEGPETITLQTAKAKKPAVFPHWAHQAMEGMTCGECHHGADADGKQVAYVDGQEIGKCESCHNDTMANKKLNSFKNAGHENCKECHKEKAAAGNTKAPTKCNGCHVKE